MDTEINTIELQSGDEDMKKRPVMRYGEYNKPPVLRTPANIIAAVTAAVIAFGLAVTAITLAGVSYTSLQNVKNTVGGETTTINNLTEAQNNLKQSLETLNITLYQTIQDLNFTLDANLTNEIRQLAQLVNTTLDNLQSEFSNITETLVLITNYTTSARTSADESLQYSQDSLLYSQDAYNSSLDSAASSNISTAEAQLSEYYANVSKTYYEDVMSYLQQVKNYYNASLDLFALVNDSTITNEALVNNASNSALMALMYANQSQEYAGQSQSYANQSLYYSGQSQDYSNSSLSYYLMTAFSYNQSVVLMQEMEQIASNFNSTVQYIIDSGILNGNLTNSTSTLLLAAIVAANETLQYMETTHNYLLQVQEIWGYIQSNETQVAEYLQQVIELTSWSQGNASISHNYSLDSQYYASVSEYYADIAYNISQDIENNRTISFTGLIIGDGQIVFLHTLDTTITSAPPGQNSTIYIPDPQATNSSFVLSTGDQTIEGNKTFTSGVTLSNSVSGYVPATLDYYEDSFIISQVPSYSGGTLDSGPIVLTLTRIGNVVTMKCAKATYTTPGAGHFFILFALPARYMPGDEFIGFFRVTNGGAHLTNPGLMKVTMTGDIDWYLDASEADFSAGSDTGILSDYSASWIVSGAK